MTRKLTKPANRAHPSKEGPALVGPARRPFGVTKGKIAPLPIRAKTGMGVIATLLKRGATMKELERANRKGRSKSTVGQHIQHIRYRGYEIIQDHVGRYRMKPPPLFGGDGHAPNLAERNTKRPRTTSEHDYADEVGRGAHYVEGAVRQVVVNAFERDRQARLACIKAHDARCAACDVSFQERYGSRGKGFIHVHHKRPLARLRRAYRLDPVKDLVPVCPNCHAMLHRGRRVLTIAELRRIIRA